MAKVDDQMREKLNNLDAKLSKLTAMFFSYHLATMKYLKDKGIADEKEFGTYLTAAKREFKELEDDVDFWKMMKDFKGEDGK
jgi:hypothetical protein